MAHNHSITSFLVGALACIVVACGGDERDEPINFDEQEKEILTSSDGIGAYGGRSNGEARYLVIREDGSTTYEKIQYSGVKIFDGMWRFNEEHEAYEIDYMDGSHIVAEFVDTRNTLRITIDSEDFNVERMNLSAIPWIGNDGDLTADPQGPKNMIDYPVKIRGRWYGMPGTSSARYYYSTGLRLTTEFPKADSPEVKSTYEHTYSVSGDGVLVCSDRNAIEQITYISDNRMTLCRTYNDGTCGGYWHYTRKKTPWWTEKEDPGSGGEGGSGGGSGSGGGTGSGTGSGSGSGTGGSSGSGGSSNHRYPCKSCHESGDCWSCSGTGKNPATQKKCNTCRGTGKCRTCGGRGYIIV